MGGLLGRRGALGIRSRVSIPGQGFLPRGFHPGLRSVGPPAAELGCEVCWGGGACWGPGVSTPGYGRLTQPAAGAMRAWEVLGKSGDLVRC